MVPSVLRRLCSFPTGWGGGNDRGLMNVLSKEKLSPINKVLLPFDKTEKRILRCKYTEERRVKE